MSNAFKTYLKKLFAKVNLKIVKLNSNFEITIDVKDSDLQIWNAVKENTMAPSIRIFTLIDAVKYVVENNIQGDFVECGVWKGGAIQTMALTLNQLEKSDRKIWLYDTFDGMTEPTQRDIETSTGRTFKKILEETPKTPNDKSNYWCHGTLDVVVENLKSTKYPFTSFEIIRGDVLETLKTRKPKQIALLRLDTDLFESTKFELETLYPLLNQGGVLIIDDYGHFQGARTAVDNYLMALQRKPLLTPIDYTCRVAIKF